MYICEERSPWIHKSVVPLFRHSGNAMAVVYVYMSAGVGRLNVAYPYVEAMQEPDLWDKRARDITPTSFLFP